MNSRNVMNLWGKFLFIALLSIGLTLTRSFSRAEFYDVPQDNPYKNAIEYTTTEGIFNGYSNGKFFKPATTLNRAELIKIIVSMKFDTTEVQDCIASYFQRNYFYVRFRDVPTDSWYAPYVCLAEKEKIVRGYPDETFRPDQKVTFSEAAKMIIGVFNLETSSGGEWYTPFIRTLEKKSAIPTTIDTFDSFLRRGEFAEIIYRLEENITDSPSKTYQELASFERHPCDNCIFIAKLGVQAPIIFGAGEDAMMSQDWPRLDREILQALQGGVVHYPFTALPGQRGNVFITGHSSYYSNDPGSYNYVFTKLAELDVGDTYNVFYNGKKYEYRIYEEKIVLPENVEVLEQKYDRETSTLMTCWPVYTNLKRKIFVADRVF